jgi:4-amino-4-deoxy-L-arabinose transferase-like glycosyltransferase
VVLLLVGPWVDAPLNDDWQYARAAKLLAETGGLSIDTPIAPSIVVQSYLGAGVLRLFGFSHVALRLLTVLLAALGLVCIERTLRRVRVPTVWILASCALLVLNPIVLHITSSYLSEWYGYVFALLAMLLWFRVRTQVGDDDALPVWLYLVAALLAVLAFWSRQFVVLVYPALVASRLLSWWRAGLKKRAVEIGGALAGTALVAGGVLGYFAWARATGNYKPEFATPVAALTTFSAKIWLIQFSACLAYMSAAFAPVLLLAFPRLDNRRGIVVAAGCAAFMVAGLLALQVTGGDGFVPDRPLNARFPYVNNIIYPTGVGPVTVADVYVQRVGARPNWSSESAWLYIELAVLLSTVCWGALVAPARGVTSVRVDSTRGARHELCWFAAAWLFGSLILSIQAYQKDVFDRYYFPCILALVLLIPGLLTDVAPQLPRKLEARSLLAALSLLALGWFAVAGVHDYLRWNEVRNDLYQQTVASGVSPSSIDAGYEPNGWHNVHQVHPVTCIGQCRCAPWSWYCFDNSYRILMGGVPPGYELVRAVQPSYWLADGPPLSLVKRRL